MKPAPERRGACYGAAIAVVHGTYTLPLEKTGTIAVWPR